MTPSATPNINLNTGVRYGAISGNSLDPELLTSLHDMAYGVAYMAWENSRRTELHALLQAELPFGSLDKRAAIIEEQIAAEGQDWEDDEPEAELTHDQVQLHFGWLGGAPLLLIIDSLVVVHTCALCSPCVPNAADLDSGFDRGPAPSDDYPFTGYGVPDSWLYQPRVSSEER